MTISSESISQQNENETWLTRPSHILDDICSAYCPLHFLHTETMRLVSKCPPLQMSEQVYSYEISNLEGWLSVHRSGDLGCTKIGGRGSYPSRAIEQVRKMHQMLEAREVYIPESITDEILLNEILPWNRRVFDSVLSLESIRGITVLPIQLFWFLQAGIAVFYDEPAVVAWLGYDFLRDFASNPETPRKILENLAYSENLSLRLAVLANPSCPADTHAVSALIGREDNLAHR